MTPLEIIIEPAIISDLDKISRIFGQYYANEDEIKYFTEIVEKSINKQGSDPSEEYIVARSKEGNILGILGYRNTIQKFLMYSVKPRSLEIYALFVDPNHTKQGIGRNLIYYIQNIALEKGYGELIVRSASKFKDTGWPFYKKIGFEEVGSIPETGQEVSRIFRLIL